MVRFPLLLLVALLAVGCGGPPRDNPMLNDVRTLYLDAEADSLVAQHAPVALAEAREALDRAEAVWREKEDAEVVDHHAYLAQQRVHIARETARLNAAERAVEAASAERQQVLIEARAAEARAAEAAAQEAQRRAEAERQAAEAALAQARALSERVSELEAELTSRGLVLTLGDVLFDTGQATLLPGAQRAIAGLVGFLNDYPERNVLIEGHTDNVGSDATNQVLSERRANAVRDALVASGIAPTRIRTVGLGERYPVTGNDTPAGRQQNRRVEIIISDPEGVIPERAPGN